jgi:hypothetical protein
LEDLFILTGDENSRRKIKMEKTGISRQKRMWNGIMEFHKVALRPFQITKQYASADALFYTFYIKKDGRICRFADE